MSAQRAEQICAQLAEATDLPRAVMHMLPPGAAQMSSAGLIARFGMAERAPLFVTDMEHGGPGALALLSAVLAAGPGGAAHLALPAPGGAEALANALHDARPSMVIVGASTGLSVVDRHKSHMAVRLTVTGKTAPSFDPGSGVNALEAAMGYAAVLQDVRAALMAETDPNQPFHPQWSTLNVGHLTSGIDAHTVPDQAVLDWALHAIRPEDADTALEAAARKIAETEPVLKAMSGQAAMVQEVLFHQPGLPMARINTAREALLALGAGAPMEAPRAGSAGYFTGLGAGVVMFGPDDTGPASLAALTDIVQQLTRQA